MSGCEVDSEAGFIHDALQGSLRWPQDSRYQLRLWEELEGRCIVIPEGGRRVVSWAFGSVGTWLAGSPNTLR